MVTLSTTCKALPSILRTAVAVICALLFVLATKYDVAKAQEIVKIETKYSAAHVSTGQHSGKFWISGGPENNYARFLYHGDKSPLQITSNIIFKVTPRSGPEQFYCNVPYNFTLGRPQNGPEELIYKPYDSLYISEDTIAIGWHGVGVYDITMRFIVERPRTEYDNGSDILLEFSYTRDPFDPFAYLGILLMLDGDNGSAVGQTTGGAGDRSSILTSKGYFSSASSGKLFQLPYDSIPEFYHIGNFEYSLPLNVTMPIHRLTGRSHGGVELTPPKVFGVGNWQIYRKIAWNMGGVSFVGDVATALRWDSLVNDGLVRTAFGTNNRSGNDMYHCRNKDVFVDIRTARLIQQPEKNGEYSPNEFDIELWISNTSTNNWIEPTIRLDTPIVSYPFGSDKLLLDPSTPPSRSFQLAPQETKKFTWHVKLNPVSNQELDTLLELRFYYRHNQNEEEVRFLDDCAPLIAIKRAYDPPPDTYAPVVERKGNGRGARQGPGNGETAFWDFSTYDRHDGFDYDTGLERIEVLESNNFTLLHTPESFRQCLVEETVNIRGEVIDTALNGRIVFAVYDCAGNRRRDSITYNHRPDIFSPEVALRVESGRFSEEYPCSTPFFDVTMEDRTHQFPETGDHGFGKVKVVSSANFKPITIVDQRGGSGVRDFDQVLSFKLEVDDILYDASAEVLVSDYAGNDTTLFFNYCTVPDLDAPVVVTQRVPSVSGTDTTWRVDVTDNKEWDRGLREVIVVANLNGNIQFIWPDGSRSALPPPIKNGDEKYAVDVEIVNECEAAELILEFRDTYYESTVGQHTTFDTIKYDGIPDVFKPNILVTRDWGVSGTVVFVVDINDIHPAFNCDRGLDNVQFGLSPNMAVRTPLVISGDRTRASLVVEVIDSSAINTVDSVCIVATDRAGNMNDLCHYWPSDPDDKSPIFVGNINPAGPGLTGTASDWRLYDRGLHSVTIRNPINLAPPYSYDNLGGIRTTPVSIAVADPTKAISGTIVVKDLYGAATNASEEDVHTIEIPFSLPSVELELDKPDFVEGNTEFDVKIVATTSFPAGEVREIDFDVRHVGNGTLRQTTLGKGGVLTVTPAGANILRVHYETLPGETYNKGDVIGTLTFYGTLEYDVTRFTIDIVAGTGLVNNGDNTVITVRKPDADIDASQLTLPPPFFRVSPGGTLYVNGECGRILNGQHAGLKPAGLAILAIKPQPLSVTTGEGVELLIRDVPQDGATGELVSATGDVAARFRIEPSGATVTRSVLQLPQTITTGMYMLRLSGTTGHDWVKIIVAD